MNETKKEQEADPIPKCAGCSVSKEFCSGCIINIYEKIQKEIEESENYVAFTW